MHEFSLTRNLIHQIETIAEAEAAARVVAVRVKLGALSHISEEHFREHFQQEIIGTIVDGAKLLVDVSEDINDLNAQRIVLDTVEVEGHACSNG